MYKGIYVALSGALLKQRELDVVTNNLANASTVGYKKSLFSARLYQVTEGSPFPSPSLYPAGRGMSYLGSFSIDPSEGPIRETGNPLDLAIRGEGFFRVSDGKGTYFTRNGQCEISPEGFLVTSSGMRVLDESGNPISLPEGQVQVAPDGSISVDGNLVGRIGIYRVEGIRHVRDSLFAGQEAGRASGEVVQGALEFPNVSPVMEMVNVIRALREFDVAQRMIRSMDELSHRAVSEIARVR
ncbi:MAG: flagellar hook-basal body protein [Deltaproteobacteria bacterium]|nr:MAG: flagellar hook-basal body protein [Deltaproteobacteria bacterium]